jgi:putative hydrolase of the HAD superfamily
MEWTVPDLVTKLFRRLGLPVEEKHIEGFFEAYYERVNRELFVYDDTVETLELLKPSYPVMGLVSNTIFPEPVHLKELESFGIAPYLDFTVFSSTFGVRKPHADIFYHAANRAGFSPSECLYVGDRYVEDIKGPNAIGMDAILKIKAGRDYPEDMPDTVRRIDTLAELLDILER